MALPQAIFKEHWPRWQHSFSPKALLRLGGVQLSALPGWTPEMASQYLSPDELAQWAGMTLEKRRTEWLGGRLAAKWAAAGLLGKTALEWRSLIIRTETGGRPFVAAEPDAAAPFISISHSGPLAAALAANIPCGLDIQQTDAKIHTVKKRFAAPEEEAILNASLPPGAFRETERLTMLWAAKESVRKMVRLTPLLGLLEIRLLAGHGGSGTPQEPLALTFAADRAQATGLPDIHALCFFADRLAWAMACPTTYKE